MKVYDHVRMWVERKRESEKETERVYYLFFTFHTHSDNNVPVCNCGEVAQLLTVRREDSANKGMAA